MMGSFWVAAPALLPITSSTMDVGNSSEAKSLLCRIYDIKGEHRNEQAFDRHNQPSDCG